MKVENSCNKKYNFYLWALWIVLGIIIVLALYYPALDNYFYGDDFWLLNQARLCRLDPTNLLARHGNYFRPIITLHFTLVQIFSDLRPVGYHIASIILHIFNGFLLALLVSRICSSTAVGLLTGSFLWFNAVPSDAVYICSASGTLLVAAFYLLCLIFFQRFGQNRKLSSYALSLFFFICTLSIREEAATLILILFLFSLLIQKISLSKVLKSLLPFMIVLILYLIMQFSFSVQKRPDDFLSISYQKYETEAYQLSPEATQEYGRSLSHVSFFELIKENKNSFKGLIRNVVIPSTKTYVRSLGLITTKPLLPFFHINKFWLWLWLAIPVLLAFLLYLAKLKNQALFWILWILITMLPFLMIVAPIYRGWQTYLPSMGMMALLAYNLKLLRDKSSISRFKESSTKSSLKYYSFSRMIIVLFISYFLIYNGLEVRAADKKSYLQNEKRHQWMQQIKELQNSSSSNTVAPQTIVLYKFPNLGDAKLLSDLFFDGRLYLCQDKNCLTEHISKDKNVSVIIFKDGQPRTADTDKLLTE